MVPAEVSSDGCVQRVNQEMDLRSIESMSASIMRSQLQRIADPAGREMDLRSIDSSIMRFQSCNDADPIGVAYTAPNPW